MLLAELEDFVVRHRACGRLTGDASEPEANGYLLRVGCSCGVAFLRWVTLGGEGIGDVGLGDLDELRSAWCDVLLCWVSPRMLSSEPLPRHESTTAASIPGSQSHSRVEK